MDYSKLYSKNKNFKMIKETIYVVYSETELGFSIDRMFKRKEVAELYVEDMIETIKGEDMFLQKGEDEPETKIIGFVMQETPLYDFPNFGSNIINYNI